MYEKDFSKRLSELRIQKGVSARDMSLSLGQNSGYINHIENKQALPSLPVFFNICDYFGISPEEFFAEKKSKTINISSLSEELKFLTPEQLACISLLIHEFLGTG